MTWFKGAKPPNFTNHIAYILSDTPPNDSNSLQYHEWNNTTMSCMKGFIQEELSAECKE